MMSQSFIENAYALFWIRFTKIWDIDDMKMLFFPNLWQILYMINVASAHILMKNMWNIK